MKSDKLSRYLTIFLATGAYTGYCPIASGTAGTLAGVALYFLLPQDPKLYLLSILVCFVIGSVAAHKSENIFNQKDSGLIVIDEIVGYFVSMFALPATWGWIWGAFFLFRIFDIIKPPPAAQCERIPGGLGVMADDLFAGIYTNIVLQIIRCYLK